MTRTWIAVLGALLVLLAAPTAVQAQQGSCQQVLPSDFRRVVDARGNEIIYFRDPVRMLCTDGVEIEADSAVMNRTAQTLELVGRVRYLDGERQLVSDWAHYLARTDELFARGSVVLTDLADGSTISGDDLEYRRATEQQPESRLVMRGERPHAVMNPAPDPGAAEDRPPLLVWARRMEVVGETRFLAQTDVEFQRGEMTGAAQSASFDQAEEHMTLTGRAHVRTDEYRLDGERIDARMRAEVIQEVVADRAARLAADELTVQGETIRISFADGEPEQVEAWTPADRREAGDGEARTHRAIAISDDFRIRADSIDARSEGGRLRLVTAVGAAYGERAADSLSVELPDLVSRDWIQGDTIIGHFVDAPVMPTEPDPALDPQVAVEVVPAPSDDETSQQTVLERIEVVGGSDAPALSLYRTAGDNEGAGPSVNFMRALRITLFMRDGEVHRVEADGPLEGIYIDPAGTASRSPAPQAPARPPRQARR